MTNLLPEERRKKIERERWVRMTSVGTVFFLTLILLSIVSLVPSLLLSKSKGEDAERQVGLVQEFIRLQEEGGITQEVENIQNQLALLENELNEAAAARSIISLSEEISSGVILESIRFERLDNKKAHIVVSGFAQTRDDLLLFAKSVEQEPAFVGIDLPVSNLAKSTDISFLFTVNVVTLEI
jgi:hypothetical protein